MSTYFGYVEREADNYINWADVSKDIATTFDDINKVREGKKQVLDDDYRAALKELTLQPKGKDEEANKYITEYADNASNFLMMQNRLLKQGKLKVKDYVNARQNLGDGTDNLFKIMKDYQANYGAIMDAYKEGKLSAASLWKLKQVEKFADFSKSGAYIAADGSVMQAMKTKKIVNGKEIYTLDTKPGEVASMSVLLDTVNNMINRYDANAKTTEIAKSVGTYIQSMYINGQIASIEDITALEYGQDPLETTETLRNAIADLNTNEKNEFVISEDKVAKTKKTALGNETEVAQMYKSAKAKAADQLTDADKKVINFVETKLSDLIEKSKGPKFKFEESETKMILAAMPQDEDIMSVLVDNKQFAKNGLEYDFLPIDDVTKVDELTKKNPNIIYMANVKGQSVPVLSKAQKEEAVEYMRGIARAKYTLKEVDRGTTNVKEAGIEVKKPSNWDNMSDGDKEKWESNKKDQDTAMHFMNLYNGTEQEIEIAKEFFENNPNVGKGNVKRTLSGVDITYKVAGGGTATETIPFFTTSGKKALGTTGFFDAGFNILNEVLGKNSQIKNYNVAKSYIANNKKNTLMPNMETFFVSDSGNRLGYFTPEDFGFETANTFGMNLPIEMFIQKLNEYNKQGGGSAAGGKSAAKEGGASAAGASAAGGKAR